MVLAGFALHSVPTPNATLIPALVVGLRRVLMLQRPGIVKMPFFLTCAVATAAKLSKSPVQTFVFNSCFSARALKSTPFVMPLLIFMKAWLKA